MKLTDRQQQVLAFIDAFASKRRLSPTLVEICEHFGFASPNAAKSHLIALEKKGYIKREANVPRSIEVLRLDDGSAS